MAVAYRVASGLLTRLWRKIPPLHSSDIVAFVTATVGTVGLYMNYEASLPENDAPLDMTIPTTKPTDKKKVTANPTVKNPIDKVVDTINKNTTIASDNAKSHEESIASTVESLKLQIEGLSVESEGSPLLTNQVALVDALNSISLGIESQAIILASIFTTLDNNLGGLVSVSSINAQNNKVSGDYLKQTAANGDYGDEDYFYAFKPTSEYWHEVDVATQNQHMEQNGTTEFLMILPSSYYAPSEIDLIDSMQANSSKSEIRKAVEDFRSSHVSSEIRARLGMVLIQAQATSKEDTKAQTDFYKAETASIKAREISPTSIARDYGSTTDHATAGALASLASSLAPIRDWAELAKERETYLQTPVIVRDLDGNAIAEAKPMELATSKDAAIAREKTDINNEEFDESMFPSLFLPVLPFIGSSDIFNPNHNTPSANPFSHREL